MVELATLRHVSLSAAVVLVAEFDRWQRLTCSRLMVRTLDNWDADVVQKLRALGFFRLLGTKLPARLRWDRDREWIRFISDVETVGSAARELRIRLEKHLGKESGVASEIYIALVECMKNAVQHAYPEIGFDWALNPLVGKRWWMAATVDPVRQHIHLAFFDLGITIPRSLPHSWIWPGLADDIRLGGDHVLILEALQYGRSSLGQRHRGKGFGNIRHPTVLNRYNAVRVMSGGGQCVEIGGSIYSFPLQTKLQGTLIEWDFFLGDNQGDQGD